MTVNERMKQQIIKHGEDLNRIFNLNEDPDKLARRIHRLEIKAHRLATDYCNGENGVDSDNWDEKTLPVLKSLDKILKYTKHSIPVFVNGDARGYALKIRDEYVRDNNLQIHKDWGGYGILAPEFDGRL
jgi:hypothetical protein